MIYCPRLITDPKEINAVYEFLKSQDLDYPQYDEWCRKAKREMELGYKKIIAIYSKDKSGNSFVIGELVFQQHKTDSSMIELKNLRVDRQYRNKKICTALLADVETYAREQGYKKIICDASSNSEDIVAVMTKRSYRIEAKESLYTAKRIDVILAKDLTEKQSIISATMSDLEKLIAKMKLLIVSLYRRYVLQLSRHSHSRNQFCR